MLAGGTPALPVTNLFKHDPASHFQLNTVGEEKLTEKQRHDILPFARRQTFTRLFQYATFVSMALHFAGEVYRSAFENETIRVASALTV
jgi:hypothetical protein